MPAEYPNVAPDCDVLEFSDGLDPRDCVDIEKFITETCEDQLGEIMCFTVIRYVMINSASRALSDTFIIDIYLTELNFNSGFEWK